MKANRKRVENKIYAAFDIVDPSKQNYEYYKKKFSRMSDTAFMKFMSRPMPLRFQYKLFEIEPKPNMILKGLKMLNVPLMEKVNLPYLYEDEDGNPVQSTECQVGPLPVKKMKQFLTKKTGMSTDISSRDMRNGLLINHDKNGNTSDREFEAAAVHDLKYTTDELQGPRADAMGAKNQMINQISTLGKVSLKDLPVDPADSLSRNMLDAYLIGSLLKSNLLSDDYHLNVTTDEHKGVSRET